VIERAAFGRTGHQSSRVIFGSAGIARVDQATADRLLPLLLEHGVNHIDTAAMYGDAELRLAPWLAKHSGEFFLATKTHARDGDGARASLEHSLTRMGVDHVDLIQLHNLVEPDEWDVAHAPGGALEALQRARDEGLARFIGVTGHGLRIARMHLQSLQRFDYDSVLLPYNYTLVQDSSYRADVEELLGRREAVGVVRAAHGSGRDRPSRTLRARPPAAVPRLVVGDRAAAACSCRGGEHRTGAHRCRARH
jgi:aryl-alcohol dehydrogenase-like predicted oxidoreductase